MLRSQDLTESEQVCRYRLGSLFTLGKYVPASSVQTNIDIYKNDQKHSLPPFLKKTICVFSERHIVIALHFVTTININVYI